jgi:hypothetical protein
MCIVSCRSEEISVFNFYFNLTIARMHNHMTRYHRHCTECDWRGSLKELEIHKQSCQKSAVAIKATKLSVLEQIIQESGTMRVGKSFYSKLFVTIEDTDEGIWIVPTRDPMLGKQLETVAEDYHKMGSKYCHLCCF